MYQMIQRFKQLLDRCQRRTLLKYIDDNLNKIVFFLNYRIELMKILKNVVYTFQTIFFDLH
jgi:hypothetical protein